MSGARKEAIVESNTKGLIPKISSLRACMLISELCIGEIDSTRRFLCITMLFEPAATQTSPHESIQQLSYACLALSSG